MEACRSGEAAIRRHGPYLQAALDDGLLAARNSNDIKFALMWANHALVDIFPHDDPADSPQLLKNGAIDRAAFEKLARHVIDTYFARPNYRTDGPVSKDFIWTR